MTKCKNNCDKEVVHPNIFCSRSCAAKFNNRETPKRRMTRNCKACPNPVPSKWTYCRDCISLNRHLRGPVVDNSRTVESMVATRNDANRYNKIRQHARKITAEREQKCKQCGYDKHVETCHIKDICDFPLTATLGEVNHPDNLVLLCPNHHWEFDKGVLEII